MYKIAQSVLCFVVIPRLARGGAARQSYHREATPPQAYGGKD